jgi:hypothetical protein
LAIPQPGIAPVDQSADPFGDAVKLKSQMLLKGQFRYSSNLIGILQPELNPVSLAQISKKITGGFKVKLFRIGGQVYDADTATGQRSLIQQDSACCFSCSGVL